MLGEFQISEDLKLTVTLGMMTKFWEEGCVKTRLARATGTRVAAKIHELFTLQLCKTLAHFGDRRCLCLDPISRNTKVTEALKAQGVKESWEIEKQQQGDIGHRMAAWFASHLNTTHYENRGAILIGSDCPLLDDTDLGHAAKCLSENDVVIGPATDGGYYLIAIRNSIECTKWESIFADIPWSTHAVLSETRQRLQKEGIRWVELPERQDIDTVFDLRRLLKYLKSVNSEDAQAPEQSLLRSLTSILQDCPEETKVILDETAH